jgi:hypothetical protein
MRTASARRTPEERAAHDVGMELDMAMGQAISRDAG